MVVYEALVWLKSNNALYADVDVSLQRLSLLPEDGVPQEITSTVRHQPSGSMAVRERESYVPGAIYNDNLLPPNERGMSPQRPSGLSTDHVLGCIDEVDNTPLDGWYNSVRRQTFWIYSNNNQM